MPYIITESGWITAGSGTSPATVEFAGLAMEASRYFYVRQISDGHIMEMDEGTAARFKHREGYQVIESERALDVK